MTIHFEGRDIYLICDICGAEPDELFEHFDKAVEYKHIHGWKSQKLKGRDWEDVCPECQEGRA